MVSVFGIVLAAVVITLFEVPLLLKSHLKKELWIFSFLLLLGVGISIAHSLHVKVPNPIDGIIQLYKPVSDYIDHVLK
ncbi:hypothetical protein BRE01_48250 [Brevibacillus reuszeri]|uniref:Uncharacterized protein n=1 Tax=Brevibacillus reuszeri TaxID=54915 RepID=A0A0K9YYN3_9BACL|nr:hypothetical protein [Brevibacillus reuszeri]KNB73809.1 hypothetical protein ADS79_07725 [Brevibacillus reuszeri]MED1860046.1 hypothetical protein [Brevibacillus reuszeri]GED71123.1 hypothetical protein BRE01_48250 [Brevibacillus reuszeri]